MTVAGATDLSAVWNECKRIVRAHQQEVQLRTWQCTVCHHHNPKACLECENFDVIFAGRRIVRVHQQNVNYNLIVASRMGTDR